MLRWIIALVIVLALPEPAQGQGPDLDWVQRHAVSEEGKLLETYVSDDIGDVLSFAFDPFTPDRLLAAEYPDTYLLETVDGGQTWQRTYLQGGVITPAFAPSDPSIIYLTGGMRRVWKSDDGGASWTLLATKPFESSWLVGVAVSPVDPDIVVVASSGIVTPGPGGMYLTTDGGETWSNRATGFEHWSNNVVFSQSHPDIVFATQANGSYPLL
jgi:photosystem II stability/assembly factor-like uncharacterized protein